MAVTLIVLGYGPVEKRVARGHLNLYGRLNTLAAGMLYQRGEVERLILTGGPTGGAALPSEAELMKRMLVRIFHVPGEVFILETKATDTITNFVYTANLVDTLGLREPLGFLAFGFHLPRVRYLADLFGLEGAFIAAEEVVRERSPRHKKLLSNLLNLKNKTYTKLLTAQVRAMRGMKTMPEYWLPPTSQLRSEKRLKAIIRSNQVQYFLRSRNLNPKTPADFKADLSPIPRRFPEPIAEDREKAIRELHQEVALA